MKLIDPDLLRTFVTFADAGSLARAAEIVARSPSAVTSQMQRLEAVVGERLLAPAGRGRALTAAGEEFLVHARRMLDAQCDAWLSIAGIRADGRIAIGVTQDFAERGLPELLKRYSRTHPRVRLELRVGRTGELSKAFDEGRLDVMLAMRGARRPEEIGVLREPMIWIGADDGTPVGEAEVPLALLDAPCGFRSAALAALDAAGRPYRLAASSASLSGLRAAVASGLALSVRTQRWLGHGVADVGQRARLPALPVAEFALNLRRKAANAAADFAELMRTELAAGPSI